MAIPLSGQTPEPGTDSLVAISLTDGTQLKGSIIQEDEDHIVVMTASGLEVKVPRESIVAIKAIKSPTGGAFTRTDPNYSRLMFSPTGRPLRKGTGYFSNYYVFFPGVAYGLTDHLSLAAGLSLFPGLSPADQVLSLAPRIALYNEGDFALSAGTLYLNVGGEGAGGMAFVVGTKGLPDKSFTFGLGLGYIAEKGEAVNFAEHPVLVFGGNIRLSDSLALVSENWFITGEDFSLSEQPFGIALRFFGQNLAVDLGAIIIGEIIKEGFPIPGLSFVYHFGG
jgi:hypothetical protein